MQGTEVICPRTSLLKPRWGAWAKSRVAGIGLSPQTQNQGSKKSLNVLMSAPELPSPKGNCILVILGCAKALGLCMEPSIRKPL